MKNALRIRQRMFAVALLLTAAQESTDSDFTVRSRASGLPLLGAEDSEVAADLEKVKFGKKLSPVLLIQGSPLWVADGYHRVCASYHLNEKTDLPCRIVARSE
jgi:hypothetical protein